MRRFRLTSRISFRAPRLLLGAALWLAVSPVAAAQVPTETTAPRPATEAGDSTAPTPTTVTGETIEVVEPEVALTRPGSTVGLAFLINEERVSLGRMPLATSYELNVAAQAHSRDMVEAGFLDHIGSDGSSPQQRAARRGYVVPPNTGWIVVEVISAISADPKGPWSWWMYSSPAVHGRVLRDARWREFGVGYAAGGRYGNYWTVLVACRPGVVPEVPFNGRAYQHSEACG